MRDASKAYRDDYLWLPKSHINNSVGIKAQLTFPLGNEDHIYAWAEIDDWLVVPREYLRYEEYRDLPFQVQDDNPWTFPETTYELRSAPRDAVQALAVESLVNNGNGVLALACGKGKTVVSIMAASMIGVPALVIVPTQDLAHQWVSRITEHTSLTKDDIGWIQQKRWDWRKPWTVASIQTLAKQMDSVPEELRRHFGVVIYDEVHHLGAPYFNLTAHLGLGLRWGLSATPIRSDGLDPLYSHHLGPILYQNLDQDIIPEVWFVASDFEPNQDEWQEIGRHGPDAAIPKLMTWLGEHEGRNALIQDWIDKTVASGRVALALSDRIAQLEILADRYSHASLITGKVKGAERELLLQDYDLVFATTGLAKEGLDKPELDTGFILLPFTDQYRFQQILGRFQRIKEGRQTPVVVIIEDRKIEICKRMCRKLKSHLNRWQYPYKMVRE